MSVAKRGALGLLLLLLGCHQGARDRTDDAPATSWHYQLQVDEMLSRLTAKVCFDGAVPRELRAGRDEAAGSLLSARWLGPGAVRRLPVRQGRIQLDASTRDGCVEYVVSLTERGSMSAALRRVNGDLLASPNVWLWRPERRATEARATLQLSLPKGVRALLPWTRQDTTYRLDAEAFRFDSYAAFGRFLPIESREHGVHIEAALLAGELAVDRVAVMRWLRASVSLASLSDGHFPRERLSAIIVPSGAQLEPVAFGMVARGGSASVLLMMSATANEAALQRDWVLPHELSHLLLPFVEREHAWFSEGFATYYQEVLRARAGITSERQALMAMSESFRGAAAEAAEAQQTESLVEESALMLRSRNYRKVYWGGAAFWLYADVELRRRSAGRHTLDSVLQRLRAEETRREVRTAQALIDELDKLAELPVFSEALAIASSSPFPPFEPTLEALGVRGDGATLTLDDTAKLASIRRQLFVFSPQAR